MSRFRNILLLQNHYNRDLTSMHHETNNHLISIKNLNRINSSVVNGEKQQ